MSFLHDYNESSFTDLHRIKDRDVSMLSGGELQRFAIAMCAVQKADM